MKADGRGLFGTPPFDTVMEWTVPSSMLPTTGSSRSCGQDRLRLARRVVSVVVIVAPLRWLGEQRLNFRQLRGRHAARGGLVRLDAGPDLDDRQMRGIVLTNEELHRAAALGIANQADDAGQEGVQRVGFAVRRMKLVDARDRHCCS